MSFVLAHFSDLHLGPVEGFALRHWNVKRGLGYANWVGRRRRVHRPQVVAKLLEDLAGQHVDHIVVTGDLVNIGLPSEYENALAWLKSLGPPNRVTVVPGNHDIYVRLKSDPGVARWHEYMSESPQRNGVRGGLLFPFVRRLGAVALVGLCSAVPTPPFVAAGRVGDDQLSALGPLLDGLRRDGLVRVILIHHPPLPDQASPRRGLADAGALASVLDRHGAELILHGHNHLDMLAARTWSGGHIPVVGVASASVARRHKREPLGRYNLVRIEGGREPVRIELVGRGLREPGGPVVEIEHRLLAPTVEESSPKPRDNLGSAHGGFMR
ncbi:MAG TPA: metallophosphoesterase [Hyphomicrobiaceae bacterium]|nr:metallophosphoesterase [Hyphomicrobiaceae bacterium]